MTACTRQGMISRREKEMQCVFWREMFHSVFLYLLKGDVVFFIGHTCHLKPMRVCASTLSPVPLFPHTFHTPPSSGYNPTAVCTQDFFSKGEGSSLCEYRIKDSGINDFLEESKKCSWTQERPILAKLQGTKDKYNL